MHGTDDRHAEYSLENLKATDHLEDLGTVRSTIINWFVKKQGVRIHTGVICFRIESSHGLLYEYKYLGS
jgi:hypothetical protein